MKKILLLVSLVVMTLSITASAAYFSDITDPDLAMDVESLRLMEVVGGYGDGTYRPNESLSRAQFSKMVVSAMNATDQLGQYATYTVFPDVRPSHWAAAYINLASRGLGVVGGFADGNFNPDATITTGQAVTILMRLLGYTDADVGAVWPDGYLYQGKTVGLLDDLTFTGYEAITRGQTATLMVNLLTCDTKDGGSFATSVAASVIENVVLVSHNAEANDGTWGAMELSDGTTYKMANSASTGQLNGYTGTLLLDKNSKVMTFLPDGHTSSKTITVKSTTATTVVDSSNQTYTITGDSAVYRNGEQTLWADTFGWVNSGLSITLHFHQSGMVSHVFVGSGTVATDAVVVGATGSTTGFEALAGSTNYALYKNGISASRSDLRQYDVATYDGATNAIRISDVRLTGYFESAYPNVSNPSTITVMGHEFTVLPSGAEAIGKLKLYSNITLLLTEDLQVAGAVEALGSSARGNVVGLVTSISTGSATVELLDGFTVTGNCSYTQAQVDALDGQLVRVSSSGAGKISVSRLTSTSSSDFNVLAGKVGSSALAENVRIYETVAGSALVALSLSEIPVEKVDAEDIVYVGKDWNGNVSLLVLDDVTGDLYTYGKGYLDYTTIDTSFGSTYREYTLSVVNGSETLGPIHYVGNLRNSGYMGAVANTDGSRIANVVELKELKSVPNSAWIDQTTVVYGGVTYRVADNVAVYDTAGRTWISLSQARASTSEGDLFVDSHNVVRILEV